MCGISARQLTTLLRIETRKACRAEIHRATYERDRRIVKAEKNITQCTQIPQKGAKTMMYFHFTTWEPENIDKVLTGKLPKAMAEHDNGNKKPFIEYMRECRNPGLLQNGFYRLGGWQFSIKEYCKRYWIRLKYHGIIEVYSPDRTTIRNVYGAHNVLKIVEV